MLCFPNRCPKITYNVRIFSHVATMKLLAPVLFFLTLHLTGLSQERPSFSWSKYDTARIDLDSFLMLTEYEKELSGEFRDFPNNRQRIYFLNGRNKQDLLEYDESIVDYPE